MGAPVLANYLGRPKTAAASPPDPLAPPKEPKLPTPAPPKLTPVAVPLPAHAGGRARPPHTPGGPGPPRRLRPQVQADTGTAEDDPAGPRPTVPAPVQPGRVAGLLAAKLLVVPTTVVLPTSLANNVSGGHYYANARPAGSRARWTGPSATSG